jgi:hypothetical protein
MVAAVILVFHGPLGAVASRYQETKESHGATGLRRLNGESRRSDRRTCSSFPSATEAKDAAPDWQREEPMGEEARSCRPES